MVYSYDDIIEKIGKVPSIENLTGRNFQHYTNQKKDVQQPLRYVFPDFSLNLEKEPNTMADIDHSRLDLSDFEFDYDSLWFLLDDCWVKRYSSPYFSEFGKLVCIEIEGEDDYSLEIYDEERIVVNSGALFMRPSIVQLYKDNYGDYPEYVYQDFKHFLNPIPLDFSFIGKPLPRSFVQQDGNGGGGTNYYSALQSTHRLAYSYIDIDTTPDGIIQSMNYATYESTGNAYGDLFSKPSILFDEEEEALEHVLYIFDQYSEDERATII